MGTPKFAKSAAFPQSKAYFTAAGTLWKLDVRQWAYATVDASDVDFDLKIGSNNPTVVPGFFDNSIKKITSSTTGGNGASVRFYANLPGFTYVNFFRPPSFDAVGPLLQVHVLERRSANAQDTQLTKLNGKTFAINAPDAVTYSMDKTVVSAAAEATPAGVLAKVESDTNHVVMSCHGTLEDKSPTAQIVMWIAGERNSFRINVGNVESVFGVLKGRVAKDCVIWIGGCTIAQNVPFCKAAAKASGCHLVAPGNYTTNQNFPKGHVDLFDTALRPTVFKPDDGSAMSREDFCAEQAKFNFVVPA